MGQIVHHLADSHLNGFVRMKLMSAVGPVLKPYDQDAWAKLPDTAALPIEFHIDPRATRTAVCLAGEPPKASWSRSAFRVRRGHTRGSTCRLMLVMATNMWVSHETEAAQEW